MQVPYKTKSGVQIGKYYQKPLPIESDPDMIRWQSILLNQEPTFKTIVLRTVYCLILFIGLLLLLTNNKF